MVNFTKEFFATEPDSHELYHFHMAENQAPPKRAVWEQWDWAWHVASYAILGVYIAIKLGNTSPKSRLLLILGLSALVAVWYFPFIITPLMRWQENPRRGLPYFIVGFPLWGVLITLDVNSLMLTGMFLPLIFTRFPIGWAITVVFSVALGSFLLYILLYSSGDWFNILLTVLGLYISYNIVVQKHKGKLTVDSRPGETCFTVMLPKNLEA